MKIEKNQALILATLLTRHIKKYALWVQIIWPGKIDQNLSLGGLCRGRIFVEPPYPPPVFEPRTTTET